MWKALIISISGSLQVAASVLGSPQAANDPRRREQGYDYHRSSSIVTVTVDWLPTHGQGPRESSIFNEEASSTVSDDTETDVAIVTITTTVPGPEKTSSNVEEYTDVYAPPPEPSSTDASSSSSTFPIGFTTTVTHHGPCRPQPSTSSPPSETVSIIFVTITTTEDRLVEVTTTVTEVYSTIVRTLSTRGPYAPPLTTW